MKIQLEDIENSDNKTLKVSFNEFIDGLHTKEPVKCSLEFISLGDTILARGLVKVNLQQECSLCLKEFSLPIEVQIDESFVKGRFFEEYKNEQELSTDAFVTDLEDDTQIDVTDLIYQSLILSVPNKCVCDINCSGGEAGEKYCKEEPADPRLDIFKQIKIEKDN